MMNNPIASSQETRPLCVLWSYQAVLLLMFCCCALVSKGQNVIIEPEDMWSKTPHYLLPCPNPKGCSQQMGMYPNPVQSGESVRLLAGANSPFQAVEVFDLSGRRMAFLQAEFVAARLSTDALKPGVYSLRLRTPAGMQLKKLVVRP